MLDTAGEIEAAENRIRAALAEGASLREARAAVHYHSSRSGPGTVGYAG